jgi:hypothetical protein
MDVVVYKHGAPNGARNLRVAAIDMSLLRSEEV